MTVIHFHHYDRSPFSEKVRVAFGLKRLRWHSVIQPRWAPKPDLEPLTGGYRRTPVMQIGADVYCDTRCILAELERRFPEPGLYPDGPAGLGDALESWADRALFADALGFVFGTQGDRFPEALHADRARFTAGRFSGWDPDAMRAQLPTVAVRLRRKLDRLEALLGDDRPYLLGCDPGMADLAVRHPLWYLRENLPERIDWARRPALVAWMKRLDTIGHGERVEATPAQALLAARNAMPIAVGASSRGAAELSQWIGKRVRVAADDWGGDPVEGMLAGADTGRVSLARRDAQLGQLMVHFPVDGFDIRLADRTDAVRATSEPGAGDPAI